VVKILRSNTPLRRLLGAWAQSCIGTGAGYVALLLLTYRHVHTAWALSAVLLAEFVPAILFGSWFGSLADRYSRRVLIVTANLLQAAAYGGLVFSRSLAPIITLALLAGVGNSLERPAMRAALPVVAGDAAQLAAALYDTCRWIGLTAGPLVTAVLFAISGVALPLAANAATFLVSAAVTATVPIDAARRPTAEQPGATGVRAGLAVAFAAPAIAIVITSTAGVLIAGGLVNVSEPILATRVLGGSGSDFALLVACYGVGMAGASALVARWGVASGTVLIRRYLAAATLIAVGIAGSAISGSIAAAAVAFAATGYANALLLVSATQLIQARVANTVQGRLFGAKDMLEGAAFLIGLVAAGALVAAVGVRVTLGIAAAICAVCAAAAAVALSRRADDGGGGAADAKRVEPPSLPHGQPFADDPTAIV
jgi:MFS family permease